MQEGGPRSLLRPLKFTSASELVLAAPAAAQPYLQLMRLDKPIGKRFFFSKLTPG